MQDYTDEAIIYICNGCVLVSVCKITNVFVVYCNARVLVLSVCKITLY
jgi:hypothetical protein